MGRPQVNAEAFTTAGMTYLNYPGNMKNQTDWAFAMGINGIIFHTFQHQPLGEGIKPGRHAARFQGGKLGVLQGTKTYLLADEDGQIDISDGINILRALFVGGVDLDCLNAADSNDDAAVDVGDAIFIFHYLFTGGKSPSAPFPLCGTEGKLACENHGACLQ